MIVARIIGGLGNQMFQYAAGRALSLKLGVDFSIDKRAFDNYHIHDFGLECFDANLNEAASHNLPKAAKENRLSRVLRNFFHGEMKPYVEKKFSYNENFDNLPDNTYLDGYWQSEKYFLDFSDVIRSDFIIKLDLSSQTKRWLDIIKTVPSVSLHIRRGDYVSNPSAAAVHGTCDLNYYMRAADYIKNKINIDPVFFVFSDDLDWVEKNLKLPYKMYFMRGNDATRNYEDLRLMSECGHHIIANSSFSWWGAWLDAKNNAITVAPSRWFATDTNDTKDLIPENWIKL